MSRKARGALRFGAFAVSVLATVACGDLSRDIPLGTAIPAQRDLSACTARGCGAVTPAEPLEEGPVYRCSLSPAGALPFAWQKFMPGEFQPTPALGVDCGAKACALAAVGVTASNDRTLWVAATVVVSRDDGSPEGPIGVWLGQYAWDGELLGARTVVMESLMPGEGVNFDVTLAAGRDGHVFVAVGEELRREGFFDPQSTRFIQEFASGVVPLGDRFTLDADHRAVFAAPQLEPAGSGAVAVALGNRLALMDADQRLLWVQQAPRVDLLVGDFQQRVTVYSSDIFAGGDTGSLYHYDHQGRLLWQRTLEGTSELSLGADAQGHLLRTGATEPTAFSSAGDSPPREFRVQKISTEGESLWSVHFQDVGTISNSPIPGRAVAVDGEGRVWLLGTQEEPSEEHPHSRQHLYQVAATGDACLDYVVESRFFSITGIESALEDDGLYLFAQDGFGRVEL